MRANGEDDPAPPPLTVFGNPTEIRVPMTSQSTTKPQTDIDNAVTESPAQEFSKCDSQAIPPPVDVEQDPFQPFSFRSNAAATKGAIDSFETDRRSPASNGKNKTTGADDEEEDALDDEIVAEEGTEALNEGAQGKRTASDSRGARPWSLNTVIMLGFVTTTVLLFCLWIAAAAYVNVMYSRTARDVKLEASSCVINGTVSYAGATDAAYWYGHMKMSMLLSTFETVFATLVTDPHGSVSAAAVQSLSGVPQNSSWNDPQTLADNITLNTTLPLDVFSLYFIDRATTTCSSVWVAFEVAGVSGWAGKAIMKLSMLGCVGRWNCSYVQWYNVTSTDYTAPFATYQLQLDVTTGTVSPVRIAPLGPTLISLCSASWAPQYSTLFLSNATQGNATTPYYCDVFLDQGVLVSRTTNSKSANQWNVSIITPSDQPVVSGMFHSGLEDSAFRYAVAVPVDTDTSIKQSMLNAFDDLWIHDREFEVWLRDAKDVNSVVSVSATAADISRHSALVPLDLSYPTAMTVLPWSTPQNKASGIIWRTSFAVPSSSIIGGTAVTWNISAVEVVVCASEAAILREMNAFGDTVSSRMDRGTTLLAVATAVVGGVLLVFVCAYVFWIHRVSSSLAEDIAAILQCLSFARTMELEKAPLFVNEHAMQGLPPPAAVPAVLGSLSPLQRTLSAPRKRDLESQHAMDQPSDDNKAMALSPTASAIQFRQPNTLLFRPLSRIREVRVAQEAVNKMIESLREYRKFLPSTLFVHGELPLQDELAEELLQAIDSPAGGSPRMSVAQVGSGPLQQKQSAHSSFAKEDSAALHASGSPTGSFHGNPSGEFAKPIQTGGGSSPQQVALERVGSSQQRVASPHGSLTQKAGPKPTPLDGAEGSGEFARMGHQGSVSINVAAEHSVNGQPLTLKRRKATILTITFVGFLRMSQESVYEAHTASQTFLQIVLSVVDRNGGVVLQLSPDRVVATWNCFKTDHHHEHHGSQCAYELNRTLQAADEEFLFSDHQIAIAVTSGNVAAGTSGTATERASVVEGRCVELSSELLSLLVAINVRCALSANVAENLQAPLWSVPLDLITDEDNLVHEIFELRSGDEPPYIALMRKGFSEFKQANYAAAKELYGEAVKQSVSRGVDPTALRLLKLSIMFSRMHTPYIRVTPSWQRFETDLPRDAASPDASPKRRYRSEKRPSYMAEEQLRMELMTMRHQSNVTTTPSRPREGVADMDGQASSVHRTPRSPVPSRPDSPPGNSGLGVHLAERRSSQERRASQERRLSGNIAVSSMRRRSTPKTAALEEQIARLGGGALGAAISPMPISPPVPPISKCHAVEFRDKKDMVFRMSDHVLGKGAVGEVYMGMSETGSLCAIKSVPLPNFEAAAQGPMNEAQRRRLKRKGINVSADIEKDVDALLNEVALLSRLRHENIVGYLSSAIVAKKILVVMEYISGGSLLNLLKEFKGVPLATARRYLRDVLRGLQYLHSEDIVHRDIKPQNVLLLIDGSCKLTDFGTCQRLSKLMGIASMEGTPQYMAPEAALGKAEKASDIWSFGILMVQLLTGDLPWKSDEAFVAISFIYRLGHDEALVPLIPESLPNGAKEVVRQCCNRDASQRPTAAQLLAHPFFQVTAPTPMKSVRKRTERSVQRSPSNSTFTSTVKASGNSPTVAGTGKRLSNALLKFSAFSEPSTTAKTPSPAETEIPDLIVHGPDDDSNAAF